MKKGVLILTGLMLLFGMNYVAAERLPVPGGDENLWGHVLNSFLNHTLGVNGTRLNITGTALLNQTNITNLTVSQLINCDIKTDASGNFYCGTDASGGGGGGHHAIGPWLYNTTNETFFNGTFALTNFSLYFVNRSDWTSHDNYPAACSAGYFVEGIGDTLTCNPDQTINNCSVDQSCDNITYESWANNTYHFNTFTNCSVDQSCETIAYEAWTNNTYQLLGTDGDTGKTGITPLYNDSNNMYFNDTYYHNNLSLSFLQNQSHANLSILNATVLNFGTPANNEKILTTKNGTMGFSSAGVPIGNDGYLRGKAGTGILYWSYSIIPPTWNQVLAQNRKSNGRDPQISTGDEIEFGETNDLRMRKIGTSDLLIQSNESIFLNATNSVIIDGDLEIKNGYYLVDANDYAFSYSGDQDAGMEFVGGAGTAGFYFRDLSGASVFRIDLDGDITTSSASHMAMGPTTLTGIVAGGINVTTIYYDNAVPRSPHMFDPDPEVNYTRFCVFDSKKSWTMFYFQNGEIKIEKDDPECEQKGLRIQQERETYNQWVVDTDICLDNYVGDQENPYYYSTYENYTNGERDCLFNVEIADYNCKSLNITWYYNITTEQCEVNPILECLSRGYWWFWDESCHVNPWLECTYAKYYENHTWSYGDMDCLFDPVKECDNRGFGWFWNGGYCEFDTELYYSELQAECESRGPAWLWNINTLSCEEAKYW